jgi:sporulation protein YlmC with PRC-barrel domain
LAIAAYGEADLRLRWPSITRAFCEVFVAMSERPMRRFLGVVLRRTSLFFAVGFSVAFATERGSAEAAALRVAQATPATPASPPQPAPETKPESLGTPATVIDGQAAESLLGKKVQSAKGEDLGRIVDVIVDKAGQIRAAVIDFGGFLGVGSRKIAVDWHAIHMTPDGKLDHLVISLPQDQLHSAPVYKEGEPVVVIGPPAEPIKTPPAAPASAPPPAAPAGN